MKIGLFSDAHCNAGAVQAAIDAMSATVDEIVCMGDSVYEYRMCSETVSIIRRNGLRNILGNHEMVLLGPHGERARAAANIDPDDLEYLRDLPTQLDVQVGGGKRMLMAHGSPFPPYGDYLMPNSPQIKKCAELDVDFVVLGHTHVPMVQRAGKVLIVNPGSIGESREHGARDLVSYAVLDTDADSVEHVRFANPRL